MQVSGLLNLMGNLSLGNDNITQVEQGIFLQYLNLAHLELYQVTANFNQNLLIQETVDNQASLNYAQLSKTPYLVYSVYDLTHQRQLRRISFTDAIERDPAFVSTGNPCQYFVNQDMICFVPVQTAVTSIKVWYVPQPISLTEQTPEEEIPYPVAYHPVLVDGALYYLFQEEGGFRDSQKSNDAAKRWDAGKTRLLSYLYNSSGVTLSTFSSV
jgi:hypothetical protein